MSSFFQKHIKRSSQESGPKSPAKEKTAASYPWHSQPLKAFKRSVSNLRGSKETNQVPPGVYTGNSSKTADKTAARGDTFEPSQAKKQTGDALMDEQSHVSQRSAKPPDLNLRHSNFSSFESLNTPDNSGLQTGQSSHPTTPSPDKNSTTATIEETFESSSKENMGQKPSTVRRKPLPLNEKPSLDCFSMSPPVSNASSQQTSAAKSPSSPAPPSRPTSVQIPVPRRRSSLTAIHLDKSAFERPLSPRESVKQRASTLTSTFPQGSPTPIMPLDQVLKRDTLSPTLQVPSNENRPRTSSSGSQSAHIHLPVTFPNGAIETPKPALKATHYRCFQGHQKMPQSNNRIYPVPCMTCGTNGDMFWKCTFCCLRICGECMAEFSTRGRNLGKLLEWIEQNNRPTSEGSSAKTSGKSPRKSSDKSEKGGQVKEENKPTLARKGKEKRHGKVISSAAKEIAGEKVTTYLVKDTTA